MEDVSILTPAEKNEDISSEVAELAALRQQNETLDRLLSGEALELPCLGQDEWWSVGKMLAERGANSNWAWGAWWASAERLQLPPLSKLCKDQRWRDAGLPAASTISNATSVWKKFRTTRVDGLSFSYHKAVASLKDAVKWLERARDEGWPLWKLEAEIRAWREENKRPRKRRVMRQVNHVKKLVMKLEAELNELGEVKRELSLEERKEIAAMIDRGAGRLGSFHDDFWGETEKKLAKKASSES